jgi:hypothetical protein
VTSGFLRAVSVGSVRWRFAPRFPGWLPASCVAAMSCCRRPEITSQRPSHVCLLIASDTNGTAPVSWWMSAILQPTWRASSLSGPSTDGQNHHLADQWKSLPQHLPLYSYSRGNPTRVLPNRVQTGSFSQTQVYSAGRRKVLIHSRRGGSSSSAPVV